MRIWTRVLLLACAAARLQAGTPAHTLEFGLAAGATLDAEAGFLAAFLDRGGEAYFRLPADGLPSRDIQGRWRPAPLTAAMSAADDLALQGDLATATQGAEGLHLGAASGADGERWLRAEGFPRVIVVENSSTVAPLSKGLSAWRWPHRRKGFDVIEAEPDRWLDPAEVDLVVFSSPGWWDDFANPPGGPSRMPEKVVVALRDFVRRGGAALFIDIAQWDLEKAWPKSVRLAPLGPYTVSQLALLGGRRGGLSLAPVGVAADKLLQAEALDLGGRDDFAYPDGGSRPLHAAFAMPDPGGGTGWVAGLAFHVFEQDDSLGPAARRLLLNLMLLAGDRRLSTLGEPKAPPPPPATATQTRQRSATPTPIEAPPTPTLKPTPFPTETPPPTPTRIIPTRVPTLAPTPRPVPTLSAWTEAPPLPPPIPILIPTRSVPTLVPTRFVPTLVPTRIVPTLVPTRVVPTLVPTRVVPTLVPTRVVPTLVPTRVVPTLVPTRVLPTPPLRPRPTLVPMRVWSTPVPTLPPPTPVATWVWPTALPTRAWPTPQPIATFRPAPTRRPSPPPRPILIQTAAAAPTPRPTVQLDDSVRNALGCLASAPEPFGDGGVYLRFCLGHDALVRVQVFDPLGRTLWSSEKKRLPAGNHQWFFEGRVSGTRLPPGGYLFQVQADYGQGRIESRQGSLTRRRDRKR